MRQLIKSLLAPIFYKLHGRDIGKKMEVQFWTKWFQKKGWLWKDNFQLRLSTESEVISYHREVLEKIYRPGLSILDVGAGPITGIYARFKGEKLNIRACDPLGDDYRELMKREGITPRVITETTPGEKIASYFTEKFDWINCENAMDHSEHPNIIIEQMLELLKDDGVITLYHETDEGLREGYRGFHKWNFSPVGNATDVFTIWNPDEHYEFRTGDKGLTIAVEVRGEHIYCVIRKAKKVNGA